MSLGESQRRQFWLLLAFAVLLLASGIGLRDPWPADEPRFALVAKQMVDSGEWLFPHRGNELYSDKPPMFMWMQASAHALTGSWRIAFLLPSLLAGLLTLGLVYDLSRRLHGRRVALVAVLGLLFTLQFTFQVRAAQIDATLLGIMTLACYGLLRHLLLGPNWRWLWIGCFAAGIGTITKGVAFLALLLIPLALAGRRLGWQGLPPRRAMSPGKIALAVLAFVLAVSLWLVPMLWTVWRLDDPAYTDYARDILLGQTASRYLTPTHHLHPPWYYLQMIASMWLPISFALIWAIPHWWRGWRRGWRPARVWLPLSFAVLIVFFFSLSGGKRDVYIMPALPMLVLALAPLLPGILRKPAAQRLLFAMAALLAVGLTVGSLYAIYGEPAFAERLRSLRGLDPWPITLTMGLCALACLIAFRPRRGALALAGSLTAIWLIYSYWAYPVINDSRSARGVMQQAGTLIGPDAELGLLSWKEQNLLMADRPATVFGFLAPRAEQELKAVAWLREAPEKRWIMAQKLSLKACFEVDKATVVGESNRRRWYLVNADALRPQCEPHPPEAWTRHKVAWH
ncbi:MAG: glycosyltransferase family 39 protein [Lysobacterales bacterium]